MAIAIPEYSTEIPKHIPKLNKETGLYETENVKQGLQYWRDWILSKMVNIFVYDGLPETLIPRELERRAMAEDKCAVIRKDGKLYPVSCQLAGVDAYNEPYLFTYAQPVLGSDTREIGDNGEILYCTALSHAGRGFIPELITRYAQQLADIESSITISIINSRMTNSGQAKDQPTADSVKGFFSKIRQGVLTALHVGTILDTFQPLPTSYNTPAPLSDFFFARDNILRALWAELGIEYVQHKRTVTLADEIAGSDATLDCALADMYLERVEFCKRLNKAFGLNCSVRINPVNLERGGDNEKEPE